MSGKSTNAKVSNVSQYPSKLATLNVAKIVPWARIRSARPKDVAKLVKSITERNFVNLGSFVVVTRIDAKSPHYVAAQKAYEEFVVSVKGLSKFAVPVDYIEEKCYYGIIDGCHRITALKQVLSTGQHTQASIYIQCNVLVGVKERNAVAMARELNETASTLIVPSLLNHIEFIQRLTDFFPNTVDHRNIAQVLKAYKSEMSSHCKLVSAHVKVLFKVWLVSDIRSLFRSDFSLHLSDFFPLLFLFH
jgi:predicted nucleic acid-binding Zn finger protein